MVPAVDHRCCVSIRITSLIPPLILQTLLPEMFSFVVIFCLLLVTLPDDVHMRLLAAGLTGLGQAKQGIEVAAVGAN